MERKELIRELLSDPMGKLIEKKPFTRSCDYSYGMRNDETVNIAQNVHARLPKIKKIVVTQEQFMRELDPHCHNVLFDDNIPAITMKMSDGSFIDIQYKKTALPYQQLIKNKQVLHLTGYPMQFTLNEIEPSETNQKNFIVFKQYWDKRNQDGMKNKMVDVQKSFGDAGLLYYFNYKGEIRSRILSYEDGYVLCPHNDDNGDRILESVYYRVGDIEYIDSYDDTYMYRYKSTNADGSGEWVMEEPVEHGFDEIPLVTKRGDVAWNNVQNIIESKEILYNIFNVIQKRFGWGMLYIRGRFNEEARKINGSVILNDTSLDGNGDAKFLTPPSPEGMIATLESHDEEIQKGSSTTFLLPKDIKAQGDVSGIAVQLTQSMDIENATRGVIDWQNVADKMVRLFKQGLAKELVAKGINPLAVTEFENLNINAKFKVWRPFSDSEYNQMLATLKNAGLISQETGIETNTVAKPDEKSRIAKETEEAERKEMEKKEKDLELSAKYTAKNTEDDNTMK